MRRGYPGFLIDTNLVVYCHDPKEKAKQRRAVDVLDRLAIESTGALSVQVLAEFLSVASTKLRSQLTIDESVAQVEELLESFTVFDLTPTVILQAARAVRTHQMSYWDAQIWATAKLNQIPIVLSEDFSDGTTVEGVTFVNPFKPSFDLASLAL